MIEGYFHQQNITDNYLLITYVRQNKLLQNCL